MRWTLFGGLIFGLLVLLMNAGKAPQASAPWCAYADDVGTNCGFYSLRQCEEYLSGLGGYCNRNPFGYGADDERSYRDLQPRHLRSDWREPRQLQRWNNPGHWRTVRRQDGWLIQRHTRSGAVRAVANGRYGQRMAYRLHGGRWVASGE